MRSDEQPVIPGFYPDPTICKVGDDYYLANSSFEYFPGAPIWHSRDLVTWEQMGNILTTREQFVEGDSRPSQGIYGSTLRHHEGTFYFITTNVSDYDHGQVIVTATDPCGPWSAPVFVPEAKGIDPDLCWDSDGQCLITWKHLDFEAGSDGIRQAPIDLATGRLLAPSYPLWQGTGAAHPEGPHLYRIGDTWYLFLAEGGTERGHSVIVARSQSPRGPFEPCPLNPIFTRRSTAHPVQSVGHADLVETPDGGWAIVHLATRPRGSTPAFHVLGRETFLAGITWEDGWPVVDATAFEVPVPATGFSDDFDGPTLHPRWVVPSGVLPAVGDGPGVDLAAGARLSVRVRDLRWEASARIAGDGAFEVRMDPRHGYGVRVADGTAVAYVRIGGVVAVLGQSLVDGGEATLTLASRDPDGPDLILGDAGPDVIVMEVNGRELARFDGRYLSTEVAAGFTGRVLTLGDDALTTRVLKVEYQAR